MNEQNIIGRINKILWCSVTLLKFFTITYFTLSFNWKMLIPLFIYFEPEWNENLAHFLQIVTLKIVVTFMRSQSYNPMIHSSTMTNMQQSTINKHILRQRKSCFFICCKKNCGDINTLCHFDFLSNSKGITANVINRFFTI